MRGGADAVVPGLGVADTIKAVGTERRRDGHARPLLAPCDPDAPGLPAYDAHAAHAAADPDAPATDDAGLARTSAVDVLVVPGDEEAFKVTRPLDLLLAEAVLARRRAAGVVV